MRFTAINLLAILFTIPATLESNAQTIDFECRIIHLEQSLTEEINASIIKSVSENEVTPHMKNDYRYVMMPDQFDSIVSKNNLVNREITSFGVILHWDEVTDLMYPFTFYPIYDNNQVFYSIIFASLKDILSENNFMIVYDSIKRTFINQLTVFKNKNIDPNYTIRPISIEKYSSLSSTDLTKFPSMVKELIAAGEISAFDNYVETSYYLPDEVIKLLREDSANRIKIIYVAEKWIDTLIIGGSVLWPYDSLNCLKKKTMRIGLLCSNNQIVWISNSNFEELRDNDDFYWSYPFKGFQLIFESAFFSAVSNIKYARN